MANYLPAVIWIIGALICFIVLRKRGVKFSLLWNITLVIAGPLAIPFAFLARPNKVDADH
jgi:hypothetical protein